jgi:hypothetical protein
LRGPKKNREPNELESPENNGGDRLKRLEIDYILKAEVSSGDFVNG